MPRFFFRDKHCQSTHALHLVRTDTRTSANQCTLWRISCHSDKRRSVCFGFLLVSADRHSSKQNCHPEGMKRITGIWMQKKKKKDWTKKNEWPGPQTHEIPLQNGQHVRWLTNAAAAKETRSDVTLRSVKQASCLLFSAIRHHKTPLGKQETLVKKKRKHNN